MPKKGERDPAKEQMWRRIIQDWQVSGLSAAEFCRLEDLKYSSLSEWRRKIIKRDKEAKLQGRRARSEKNLIKNPPVSRDIQPPPDFAPVRLVEIAPPDAQSSALEIVLRSGITVRVGSNCPLGLLRSVVSVLEVN